MKNKLRNVLMAALSVWSGFGFFYGTDPVPEDAVAAAAAYPKDYFMAPVSDALLVTGTFGELRSNHFHSGIDLKSKTGGVGLPVYAAAEGYIDQIKVQSGGYGNVLYIKHPNGYVTVYAHLDKFSANIAALVKETQYKRERFEVVIDLPKDKYKVKKGEEIGKMGNTGGSTGPHLHFEVRNSSGRALNPLLFGIIVPDSHAPDVRDMKVYYLTEQREVIKSAAWPVEKRAANAYGLKGAVDEKSIGAWRVGFSVKTYDRADALRNDNGIYAAAMYVNGELSYSWRAESLDFDETRYLNALCDYPANKRYGAWFHRLFSLPGDKLSMYDRTATMGMIPLSATVPTQVTIKLMDYSGNTSVVQFTLLRSENMEVPDPVAYQYVFPFHQDNRVQTDDFTLSMPKGTLYEDLKLKYYTTPDESAQVYSEVHHIHESVTPVHQYYEIGIVPRNIPEQLKSKAIIARCSSKRPDNCGGQWQGNRLVTKVRSFGDYCVMTDVTPPVIAPVIFEPDMRKKSAMAFRISDNFDATDRADGLYWRGTIDGAWVLFEYDSKRSRLTHTFDGRVTPGEHTLRLLVRDDRGNETVFEKQFKR